MIYKSTHGNSPDVEITIGGVVIDYFSVSYMRFLLEENTHDMLELVISGLPPKLVDTYWGSPVNVKVSTGSRFYYEFAGYVDQVRPHSNVGAGVVNNSPFQLSSVICLGASYHMRGSKSRDWSGHRLEDIASEMALSYGFSLDCKSGGYTYDTMIQASESDWKFLTRIASLHGLSVNVHGTRMRVYDQYAARSRFPSFHVLYSLAETKGDVTPGPGQIFDFKANLTKKLPYQSSVLTPTGDVLDLTGESTHGFSIQSRTGSHDLNVSQGLARIASKSRSVYDHEADVRVNGVAGCVPGGVVKIQGFETAIDGFWYVKSVEHRVEQNRFFSDLRIARDDSKVLDFTNIAVSEAADVPIVRASSWAASKRYTNVYS